MAACRVWKKKGKLRVWTKNLEVSQAVKRFTEHLAKLLLRVTVVIICHSTTANKSFL